MGINKRLINTGGGATPAPFDPLANFETVTYTGTGASQKITGYIRKGAAFNGSSSKITTNDKPMGSSDTLTISFWARNITVSDYCSLFGEGGDSDLAGYRVLIKNTNDGNMSLSRSEGNGSYVFPDSFFYDFGTDGSSWVHCVMTASATQIKYYKNGVNELTQNVSNTSTTVPEGNLLIGRDPQYSRFVGGNLDQIRIFNTTLTQANVNTLYAETYASATKSTTDIFGNGSGVVLYELDDNSLSSNFGQAAVFNGSSSGISIPLNVVSVSSAYTVSLWFNAVNVGVNSGIFSNQGTSAISNQIGINIISSTQINLASIVNNGSNTVDIIAATVPTMSNNNWYNLVVVADRSLSNKVKLYLNGVEASNYNVSAGAGSNTLYSTAQIGRSDGRFINGKLDQVRLFNATLAQVDITKLYKESSQIPTTNLVAHYTLNGNALDSKGSNNGTETSITYAGGVYSGTDIDIDYLGMAFSPSLVWIKQRSGTRWHELFDSVRGATKRINSNEADAQGTASTSLTSFDTNGFTLGSDLDGNQNGQTFVAWSWKAAASNATNNDGTIQSTVRANVDAGFSIVKSNSPSSGVFTVGHGLNAAPELYIIKNLDSAGGWLTYVKLLGANKYLQLNNSDAAGTNTNFWNNTDPTTTVFTMKSGSVIATGVNFSAYCWHSVSGYQKVGSYNGTGNSGNNIDVGFVPRFVMIKRTDSARSWLIFDSVRGASKELYPDLEDAEYGSGGNVINSNGFAPEGGGGQNVLNGNYIYLAIA